jgi:hypothetical protein
VGVTVESAILASLSADSNVTDNLGTFYGATNIFVDIAPQEATGNYLVFDAQKNPTDHLGVDNFMFDFDIYGDGISSKIIRALTIAIEFNLDGARLNCDNYKTIRFSRESEGYVDTDDIRKIHYNMQMSARATRYAWMQQL